MQMLCSVNAVNMAFYFENVHWQVERKMEAHIIVKQVVLTGKLIRLHLFFSRFVPAHAERVYASLES